MLQFWSTSTEIRHQLSDLDDHAQEVSQSFTRLLFRSQQYLLSRSVSRPTREPFIRKDTGYTVSCRCPPRLVGSNLPVATVVGVTEKLLRDRPDHRKWMAIHCADVSTECLAAVVFYSYELRRYSAVIRSLYKTVAPALHSRLNLSQTTSCRNIPWYWLEYLFLGSEKLVVEKNIRALQYTCLCSPGFITSLGTLTISFILVQPNMWGNGASVIITIYSHISRYKSQRGSL